MDPLFSWKKGARWTFGADFSGQKRTAVLTVTGSSGDRTDFEYDLFEPGDPQPTASADEAWYADGDYVVWGSRDADDSLVPYWRVFKRGAEDGAAWPGLLDLEVTAHMGKAEVVVPAGTFKDAIHIRVMGPKIHDFFFAPGVGLVKWETGTDGGEVVLELREFSAG